MVLSLQGGMAAGKTTAACYLRQHAPYVHVVLEENASVVEEVRRRGLDKKCYEDYIEIQRLYLRHEVLRWQEASAYPCSVMDYGAEEIEFYTLFYLQTIGKQWNVELPLKQELAAVRACMPDRILFLDAADETLRRRRKMIQPVHEAFLSTRSPAFCLASANGFLTGLTLTLCVWIC